MYFDIFLAEMLPMM